MNIQATRRICSKELTLLFSSPMAYLFVGVFSALNLFVFFWVEAFFARNISDLNPLFEWMPILLVFLCSALTMRSWSEEIRQGTIEHILTQPVSLMPFIVGKFLACFVMLAITLVISLPLAFIVNISGNLDWGPVISGYLASLLLGSAYISIGLFTSARSENQIVALIYSVAICGILYLIGSSAITQLFSAPVADVLRAVATGSHFEAITRGIVDFGDITYYLSLIGLGMLATYSYLEKSRWKATVTQSSHLKWHVCVSLIALNILVASMWTSHMDKWRWDVTEGHIYSISEVTERQLDQLQEPLLIRGYFSSQTHPLLAPLLPQMVNLLKEYEISANGKVQLQIIDPPKDPEAEDEANGKYGIRPTPFQIQDRYQASVVNSYFDVLLQYGDEYTTLNFRDLIDIRQLAEDDVEVRLRNPEYDITNAIRKIIQAYQSEGNIFANVSDSLTLTAYISNDSLLPQQLQQFKTAIITVTDEIQAQANGQFSVNIIDPQQDPQSQQFLNDNGLNPMTASLLNPTQFYFYLLLFNGDQAMQIPLGDLQMESFRTALESSIKRFSQGFTKTIGIASRQNPGNPNFGVPPSSDYSQAENLIDNDYNRINLNLDSGYIEGSNDAIVLLGINQLTDEQLFAVDQYLMRGGTVIIAASAYSANLANQTLTMEPQNGSLIGWLEHHGLQLQEAIVMDEQSAPFAIPVRRNVGNFSFEEMRLLQYPYFVDVRDNAMATDSAITSGLQRMIFAWASPIVLTSATNSLQSTQLARTSPRAWSSTDLNVLPRVNPDGSTAFVFPTEREQFTLGVKLSGRFQSYFRDKNSPLLNSQHRYLQCKAHSIG